MALLKSLIQRLLDSRTTPSEAANALIPAYSKNTQTAQTTGTDKTFSAVAPYDCFVTANVNSAQQSSSGDCAIGLLINGVAVNLSNMKFLPGNVWFDRGAFARKGDVIEMRFDPWSENAIDTQFKLTFHKLIGGGVSALKNALLQGGAICLSNLCSSLRRSSLLAKRNGSEVKVFSQTQIPEQRSLLTTLRLSFIRLQVMDGLHSAETGHRSMSALPESWERVALTLKVISELQLRFGRGIPLVSIARRTISNRLRQNSFLAKGQRSTSLVGGASC